VHIGARKRPLGLNYKTRASALLARLEGESLLRGDPPPRGTSFIHPDRFKELAADQITALQASLSKAKADLALVGPHIEAATAVAGQEGLLRRIVDSLATGVLPAASMSIALFSASLTFFCSRAEWVKRKLAKSGMVPPANAPYKGFRWASTFPGLTRMLALAKTRHSGAKALEILGANIPLPNNKSLTRVIKREDPDQGTWKQGFSMAV